MRRQIALFRQEPNHAKHRPRTISDVSKEKILWSLLILQIVLSVCSVMGVVKGNAFTQITTYLPLILLVLHAGWTLTIWRGLGLIVLGSTVGWAAEAFSLHYGTLFGGNYTYPAQASLLGVPLAIIVYWAVFIYLGYWLVTTFLFWLGKEKPNRIHTSLISLAVLVLADGLAVTAIDLFMDPTSVKDGSWTWTNGGPYFGVPIGNFVGWFFVTVIVTGLFRWLEYRSPRSKPNIQTSIFLMPVLGYLLAGVIFLIRAMSYHLPLLAILGTVIMILPATINVVLYIRHHLILYSN